MQVEQTARGGDQNVHAFFQLGDLRVHADATKDHGRSELQVFAVVTHRLFDLSGQFAGGGQDQHAHPGAPVFGHGAAAHGQLVQHGQGEGGGFAGAGLGPSQQILTRQNGRDGLGLDGGWVFVAQLAHGFEDRRGEIQFIKSHKRVPSWHKKIGLSDAVLASAQSRLMEFNKGSADPRSGCWRCETGVGNNGYCRTSRVGLSQSVDNRGLLFFQLQD